MRKTDLNKYANGQTNPQNQAALTFRAVGKAIWKLLVTALVVAFITGIIVSVSLFSYVMSMKDSKIEYDLMDLKLNYTSFIYVNGENDDSGNPVQYQKMCIRDRSSDRFKTSDEYASLMRNMFILNHVEIKDLKGSIISSRCV